MNVSDAIERVRRDERSGHPLSSAELDELLAGPHLLKLACLRNDGWPYVVPLWYAWQEGKLYAIGRERAAWVGFVRAEPRVGVLVDETESRHRRVQMTAMAAVVEGPCPLAGGSPLWRAVLDSMLQRYMADSRGRAYADQTAERPRVLVEIVPGQVASWSGGGWHHRYYAADAGSPAPTATTIEPL